MKLYLIILLGIILFYIGYNVSDTNGNISKNLSIILVAAGVW